uniref:Nuclear receptor-binding factor 2 MIT domain-containing protein n=1 Tax=Ciona savignyi TaxID=51511 RepID=H2Z762_CIOSA
MNVLRKAPLNQAHFHERKAERCLAEGKWDEAIAFYNTASNFIAQAMQRISSRPSLQALQLQHDFYSRQSRVIEIKRKESDLKPKFEEETETEMESTDIDYISEDTSIPTMKELQDPYSHVSTISEREPDSLLQFLNGEMETRGLNQCKRPKNNKEVIEEQQMQIKDLRKLLQTFMEKHEILQRENQSLSERNEALENQVANLQLRLEETDDDTIDNLDTQHEQDFFSFGDPSIAFQIKNAMSENDDFFSDPPPIDRLEAIPEES